MRRLSLDSNVLVYTADHRDRRHERAVDVYRRATSADCVLTIQCLAEFFHVVTRKRLATVDEAQAQVEDMMASFPAVAHEGDVLVRAITIVRDHGIGFWDAMLVATARRGGCAVLLSEDMQDGREVGGLRIVNPFIPGNDAVIDTFLPPWESMP